jgi:Tfp pilus assembly protein PilF
MKKWLVIGILTGFVLGTVTTCFVKKHYLKVKSDAAYAYGVSLLEDNNTDKAVAVLNQSIGINTQNYKPYVTLGQIYEKGGNIVLALESYRKALEVCVADTSLEKADKKFVEARIQQISMKER